MKLHFIHRTTAKNSDSMKHEHWKWTQIFWFPFSNIIKLDVFCLLDERRVSESGRDVKNNFLWLNFVFTLLMLLPRHEWFFFLIRRARERWKIWFCYSKMTKLCHERRYEAWGDVDFSIHTFNWSFHITQTSNKFSSHGMHNIFRAHLWMSERREEATDEKSWWFRMDFT